MMSNAFLRALAISLAFHVLLFGFIEAGHRLGWWTEDHLPSWLRVALLRQAAKVQEELQKKQAELAASEGHPIPLVFVEVDPSQASPEAPKETPFYSAANSLAGNPDIKLDSNQPKIDGAQDKVVKTTTVPRSEARPLEPTPAPPPPEVKPETAPAKPEPAPAKPEPVLAKTPPVKPEPEPVPAKPEEKPPPGDLAMAKPAPKPPPPEPKPVTQPAPTLRPRRLADVFRERGMPGEAIKQEGGIRRYSLVSSLDVKATPFGAYDAALIAAIQSRWYALLDESDYVRGRTGKVAVEFRLLSNGRIANIKVTETDVGELLAFLCQKAVVDPSPYAAWPSDLRKLVGGDYREVRFTFYYN